MDDTNYTKLESFLTREGARFGLILPDGWFGRPYDNMMECTSLKQSADGVTITLDEWVRLEVRGGAQARTEHEDDACRTVVDGFDELVVRYTPIGGSTEVEHRYDSGDLALVEVT